MLGGHIAAAADGETLSLDPMRRDPLHGLYPASDGYTSLVADDLDEALDWLGLGDGAADEEIEAAVASRLSGQGGTSGSPPASVELVPSAPPYAHRPDLPIHERSGIAWSFEHPFFETVGTVGAPIGFGEAGPLRPGPYIGEHTREILLELGYPPDDVDELYEAGVVSSPVPDWAK